MNLGAEIFRNPLLLGNTSFKTLYYTYDIPIDNSLWNELPKINYVNNSTMELLLESEEYRRYSKSNDPELVDNKKLSKYRYLVKNIMADGKQLGHFCAIEYKKRLQQSDNRFVTLICDVIASVMQQNSSFKF